MQIVLTALSQAAVLVPLALGLVLVYRIGGVINFAAGAICIVAGVVYVELGGSGILAVLGALLCGGLLAVLAFGVSVLPGKVLGTPPVARTLATLGFALILQWAADEFFGTSPRTGDRWVRGGIELFGTSVSNQRLVSIAVSIVFAGLVVMLFDRTLVGRGMEACSADEELARLYGLRTLIYHLIAWFVGGVSCALSGVLQAGLASISWSASLPLMITALVGVVLGGISSLRASVLGVVVVCLVSATVARILSVQIPLTPTLVLLLVGLAIRPAGLFTSEKTGERV